MLINHGSGFNHPHLAIMFSLSRGLNGILTVHVFIFKLPAVQSRMEEDIKK